MSGFPKRRTLERLTKEESPLLNGLDEQQREMVNLIVSGMPHEEIQAHFGMNPSSFYRAKEAIYKKLRIHRTSVYPSLSRRYVEFPAKWEKLLG